MSKSDLLAAKLKDHVVIFDGAIGTELYNRNFFINSCYEFLNLSNSDAVLQIHNAYVEAGAEIITTNSYGANRLKLAKHGLAEQLQEINQAAVKLARMAGNENTLVAGSVGPLGFQCGSNSTLSTDELVEIFGEHIMALQNAGVDFILGETMPSLAEAKLFLQAINTYCNVPYIISFKIDRELETAFGDHFPNIFPELLANEKQPTAIGVNCGMGPEPMLAALEKLVKVCPLPIVAQPNAGTPKAVDNRTIYMCSPEYLTTYSIRFVSLGVRGVGGCCGTTPEHIADLSRSVRPMKYTPKVLPKIIDTNSQVVELESVPVAQRSLLAEKICSGQFVKTIEITPPRGFDLATTVEKAATCKAHGIDAINLPDGPRASSRISSLVTANEIQKQAGIETILHCCCRDKNLIGMQADLLGCAWLDINNVLFITGDPPKLGDYPFASGVFDVDAIGILQVANQLNKGLDIGGKSIGNTPTKFFSGAGVDPNALDMAREISRMKEKVASGAEFFITQPVFDVEPLRKVLEIANELNVFVIAGVWPLASFRNAEFMKNEVPGVSVPDKIMYRMETAKTKQEQYETGIAIARETIAEIQSQVAGVQVSAPFGKVESALAVLERI